MKGSISFLIMLVFIVTGCQNEETSPSQSELMKDALLNNSWRLNYQYSLIFPFQLSTEDENYLKFEDFQDSLSFQIEGPLSNELRGGTLYLSIPEINNVKVDIVDQNFQSLSADLGMNDLLNSTVIHLWIRDLGEDCTNSPIPECGTYSLTLYFDAVEAD